MRINISHSSFRQKFLVLFFCFSASLPCDEKFISFPVSYWYGQGFSLTESAEIAKMGSGSRENFLNWLKTRNIRQKKKITAILLSKKIQLQSPKAKKNTYRSQIELPSVTPYADDDFFFIGGSYQNLDSRYLPLEKRNHSSFYLGQKLNRIGWVIEKRDEKFSASFKLSLSHFHLFAGNRYKPIPNFYFAKDPDFFSNFDRKDSHLPQPITESYFAGMQSDPLKPSYMFGIYSSKAVSSEPGIYFVSPGKSYSSTWAPYSRIGTLYINETLKNSLSSGWNSSIQGEGQGRADNYFGFVYLRSSNEALKLNLDATVFRDNNLLSVPIREMIDRSGVKQDLGFTRIRYRNYFALEGLESKEGLRYESGYGIHSPILFGDWGAIVIRYRAYDEFGLSRNSGIGKGLFYEFREASKILSLGGEKRNDSWQVEGKLTLPLTYGYLMEISALYRDKAIQMRSWFENWSYATDFNINLIERKEVWKLKLVGPELAVNISISQKMDEPTYIYYANFQFNQKF